MYQIKDKPIHPDYDKYPSSDGEPIAETTLHFRWIVTIKENLEVLTQGQDIFVAGDLLWYPVQGRTTICKAPDVMVCIGRPKGERLSYLQWHEDDVAPQVVFEVFSKSNRRRRNKENLLEFYEKYGVEEYYSYDPVKNVFVVYLWQDNNFTKLENLPQWVSPLLKIRFEWSEGGFEIFHPDGQLFVNFQEERALRIMEQKRRAQVERNERFAREEAAAAVLKAEAAEQKATFEAQKAEAAEQKATTAETRQKLLEERLKELGIDPNTI